MTATVRDLFARSGADAPADLWDATVRGLGDDVLALSTTGSAAALSAALVRSLDDVRRRGCARGTSALALLALDAQITHVFEMWAHAEPEHLGTYTERLVHALTTAPAPS